MSEKELFRTALSKAMGQCSRREYCSEDIRNNLMLWGVGTDDTKEIITILIKDNFVNELRYSTAFVKDRFNYNKWGKVKISSHLKAKHIPSDIIKAALDTIDNVHYTEVLKEILASHKKFIKAKNKYELKAKLLRYGLSKGFESSLLYDHLNDMEE